MTRARERRYPDEASRLRAEEMLERLRKADRKDVPMLALQMMENELIAAGNIDLKAGEYLADIEVDDGKIFAVIKTAVN